MAEDKKSATLPTGTKITGPAELIAKIAGKAPAKPAAKSESK